MQIRYQVLIKKLHLGKALSLLALSVVIQGCKAQQQAELVSASALALKIQNSIALGSPSPVPTVQDATSPVHYIVTLQPDVEPELIAKFHSFVPTHLFHHALKGLRVPLTKNQASALARDPRVLAVEPDGPIVPSITAAAGIQPGTTTSTVPAGQIVDLPSTETIPTGVARMGIPTFPLAQYGTGNLINADVAVLDTGIDPSNGLLNVVQSVGFADPGYNGYDWNGHGTHVAGTIGAAQFGYGVVGVAPGVRLWSVQVMGPTQSNWSNFLAGMDFVVQNSNQIQIVNASLEGVPTAGYPTTAIRQAILNAVNLGIVFVAAAGNDSIDIYGADNRWGTADDILPAAIREALVVSAMDPTTDSMAPYSNFSRFLTYVNPYVNVYSPGRAIDVTAPGTNILSLYTNSQAAIMSGTSMAAAHVSGLAALYVTANGRATNAAGVYKIRQDLINKGLPVANWQNGYRGAHSPDYYYEPLAIAPPDSDDPTKTWVPEKVTWASCYPGVGVVIEAQAAPGYTYEVRYSDEYYNDVINIPYATNSPYSTDTPHVTNCPSATGYPYSSSCGIRPNPVPAGRLAMYYGPSHQCRTRFNALGPSPFTAPADVGPSPSSDPSPSETPTPGQLTWNALPTGQVWGAGAPVHFVDPDPATYRAYQLIRKPAQ